MNDNYELINKCTKMSFLLGMTISALEFISDGDLPMDKKQPIADLLNRLNIGVDELCYNQSLGK